MKKEIGPLLFDLQLTIERGRQGRRQNLMLPRSGCWSIRSMPQNMSGYGLMTSKSIFSPEESKSKILRGYCRGRSVTKVVKVKLSGPVAHPRMQTCPRRPILDWKCNQTKGRVNITKGEFSIRPRTEPFSAIWDRGQSGRHLVTNVPRSYVTTKGGIRGQRWEREGKQISMVTAVFALIASQPTLWPH